MVAILVGVCAARPLAPADDSPAAIIPKACKDDIIGSIGTIPCQPITPGFGRPGIGGGAGGFHGLASQYVGKSLCGFSYRKAINNWHICWIQNNTYRELFFIQSIF